MAKSPTGHYQAKLFDNIIGPFFPKLILRDRNSSDSPTVESIGIGTSADVV